MTVPDLPPRPEEPERAPEIERMEYEAKAIRADGEGLLRMAADGAFEWRPPFGGWTVQQCFEHLTTVTEAWLERCASAIEEARTAGWLYCGPYAYGWLDRWLLLRERSRRSRQWCLRVSEPVGCWSWDHARLRFIRAQERLLDVLAAANQVDLVRAKVPHPRWPVRNALGIALWLLMAHQRRHLDDARAVLREYQRCFPVTGPALHLH